MPLPGKSYSGCNKLAIDQNGSICSDDLSRYEDNSTGPMGDDSFANEEYAKEIEFSVESDNDANASLLECCIC